MQIEEKKRNDLLDQHHELHLAVPKYIQDDGIKHLWAEDG